MSNHVWQRYGADLVVDEKKRTVLCRERLNRHDVLLLGGRADLNHGDVTYQASLGFHGCFHDSGFPNVLRECRKSGFFQKASTRSRTIFLARDGNCDEVRIDPMVPQ